MRLWPEVKREAACDHPRLPNCPFPLATISPLSMSVSLFLFCKEVHLRHFSLEMLYFKWITNKDLEPKTLLYLK